MVCSTTIKRRPQTNVLRSKFFSGIKLKAEEQIEIYEDRMIVRRNERYGNDNECIPSNPAFLEIKLIMTIAKQNR